MGSFNVGCGLSNLAIHEGDKIGLLFLTPQPNYDRNQRVPIGKAYQIYCTDKYLPYLPPIFGQYDDYGQISNIEESPTTLLLEKMFNRPIQIIAECLTSNRGIYDFNGIAEHYMTDIEKIKGYEKTIEEVLLSLGFIKDEPAKSYLFNGFALTYVKEYVWAVLNRKGEQLGKEIILYSDSASELLSIFAERTKNYPGFNPKDWEAIQLLHDMSGMFFLKTVFEEMKPIIAEDSFVKPDPEIFKKDWDKFIESTKEDILSINISNRAVYILKRETGLNVNKYSELDIYSNNLDDFRNIQQIVEIATATNHMLTPSYVGEQFGNDGASDALTKISQKILKKRLKN